LIFFFFYSYPESMTDPSYRSQILVFTTPMIGNYGIPPNVLATSPTPVPSSPDLFLESDRVQCSGVVVAELADRFSHYQAMESISNWCHRFGVPGITGVDTRAITSLLRQQGSTLAKIAVGDGHQNPVTPDQYWDPSGINLVAEASTKEPYTLNPTSPISIAMLDFGAKANIARSLVKHGAAVTVLPWDTPASSIIGKYHGLFLSNGPGDPKHAVAAVNTVRTVINDAPNMPIFGICMGRFHGYFMSETVLCCSLSICIAQVTKSLVWPLALRRIACVSETEATINPCWHWQTRGLFQPVEFSSPLKITVSLILFGPHQIMKLISPPNTRICDRAEGSLSRRMGAVLHQVRAPSSILCIAPCFHPLISCPSLVQLQ
jgi:hypothetical protein